MALGKKDKVSEQAEKLNKDISDANLSAYNLLSRRGRRLFFPSEGILSQSKEAKGKRFNATIGIAKDEDKEIMSLDSVTRCVSFPKEKVVSYSPASGDLGLREKWNEMILSKNPSIDFKMTLPIVTNALTDALYVSGFMFADEGEDIIMPDLHWENYDLIFDNGLDCNIKTFNTFCGGGFDIASLKEALFSSGEKKILVLNFPNNPTGYTPRKNEAEMIAKTVKEACESGKNIVVICDDAYFGLCYEEGLMEESIFSSLGDLHENVISIKVDGMSKEDYSWGLRIGFITLSFKGIDENSAKAFEEKVSGLMRLTLSNCSTLSQNIALSAFSSEEYVSEKDKNNSILKRRFFRAKEILADNKYNDHFEPLPCNSGYFICLKLKDVDGEKLRKKLLSDYDTGIIVMNGVVRIAFSSVSYDDLLPLIDNIYYACEE